MTRSTPEPEVQSRSLLGSPWRVDLGKLECGLRGKSPGARFSKVPKTFRARRAIRKTSICLFCKADLFICCNGNKNQNKTAKFRLRFEDTKRIMSPEMRPKSFGTFEKQAPGQKFLRDAPRLSLCYWLSRSIKLPHREVSLCTTLSFSQGHFPAPLSPNRGRHMSGSGRGVASVYPSPLYAGSLHLNCVMIAIFACLRVL